MPQCKIAAPQYASGLICAAPRTVLCPLVMPVAYLSRGEGGGRRVFRLLVARQLYLYRGRLVSQQTPSLPLVRRNDNHLPRGWGSRSASGDAFWSFEARRSCSISSRSSSNTASAMPRCYMVKKQSNKYQTSVRECWDEATPAAAAPESPTEGCVAPSYYTPLTNRTSEYV